MNEEYEYAGSPRKIGTANIILSLLLATLMFWYTHHLYSQFIDFENGNSITIQKLIFDTYRMVGKWPILLFFGIIGIAFLYTAYHHYKKYQKVKHQDF